MDSKYDELSDKLERLDELAVKNTKKSITDQRKILMSICKHCKGCRSDLLKKRKEMPVKKRAAKAKSQPTK